VYSCVQHDDSKGQNITGIYKIIKIYSITGIYKIIKIYSITGIYKIIKIYLNNRYLQNNKNMLK
jgi:hypothetical protein